MEICEVCGKQAKNVSGLKAHIRFKHAPDMTTAQVSTDSGGLLNFHLTSGPTRTTAIKVRKMIAPVCRVLIGSGTDDKGRSIYDYRKPCTDGPHPHNWYETCPHDPYFHEQEMPEVEEVREDQPDGTYVVRGRTVVQKVKRVPNLRQVPNAPRHAVFGELRKQRAKGWKFPEELGVAEFCMFMDCWSQNLPQRWVSEVGFGSFCSADHALPLLAQQRNKILEVPVDSASATKRQNQLNDLTGSFR